jgi:hypothetical protein
LIDPPDTKAQAWEAPASAETDVAVRPMTATGVVVLLVDPFPICPAKFRPQQFTEPPVRSAHVKSPPAAMAVAEVSPVTGTGTGDVAPAPLPNWP